MNATAMSAANISPLLTGSLNFFFAISFFFFKKGRGTSQPPCRTKHKL